MTTEKMISALHNANNGEQILNILDNIMEDNSETSVQVFSRAIPTMEMIDF